jgi:cytochrome c553
MRSAALIAALVATWIPAAAQDAAAGRSKAQACSVCHGPLGVSAAPDTPHLAGQPAIYLVRQLRAYRSGERKHEVMSVIAKPLTDAEIDDLSAWFSSIKIDANKP